MGRVQPPELFLPPRTQRVDKLWEDTRTLYGPMADMSEERKNSFCDWWWAEANSIMMSRRLTRDEIKRAAKISNTGALCVYPCACPGVQQ